MTEATDTLHQNSREKLVEIALALRTFPRRERVHITTEILTGDREQLAAASRQLLRSMPPGAWQRAAAEAARTREQGAEILSVFDPLYPEKLRQIADPPLCLFVKGDPRLLESPRPAVAIVGTRHSTRYGERIAAEAAEELTRFGVTVVSGLAHGIDAAAHRGAIRSAYELRVEGVGGPSSGIAVLASGVDIITPADHESLASELCETGGIVVSEYPLGSKAERYTFPERNRIIAGLSDLTLVVEAGEKSGAALTARLAAESGREVFTVPGPVTSPASRGTNRLIRDGCSVFTSLSDLLSKFPNVRAQCAAPAEKRQPDPCSPVEAEILECLKTHGPLAADGIAETLKRSAADVFSAVTALELTGRISRLPGDLYVADDLGD